MMWYILYVHFVLRQMCIYTSVVESWLGHLKINSLLINSTVCGVCAVCCAKSCVPCICLTCSALVQTETHPHITNKACKRWACRARLRAEDWASPGPANTKAAAAAPSLSHKTLGAASRMSRATGWDRSVCDNRGLLKVNKCLLIKTEHTCQLPS